MTQLKVHELATDLKISSGSILEYLKLLEYGVERNQMQPLSDEMHLALLFKFDESRVRGFADEHPDFNELMASLRERLTRIKEKKAVVPKPASKAEAPVKEKKMKVEAPEPESTVPRKKTYRLRQPFRTKKVIRTEQKPSMEVQSMATPTSINDTFDNMLSTLKKELQFIAKSSTSAIEKGDFAAAREPLEKAARISKMLDDLSAFQSGWHDIFGGATPPAAAAAAPAAVSTKPAKVESKKKRSFDRLPIGTLTPAKAFQKPILKILVSMGGRGAKTEVLARLKEQFKNTFNDYDLNFQPSHPTTPRWQISVERLYTSMIKKGLLTKSGEMGIWEITPAGRDAAK